MEPSPAAWYFSGVCWAHLLSPVGVPILPGQHLSLSPQRALHGAKCQAAPAPPSHSSWSVLSRDVPPWHLCCPAGRGAGNVGSVREPGPLGATGGFQQPQASRPSSSCSSRASACSSAEGRRTSSEIFSLFPWPSSWLPGTEPVWSRAGISGCFPKESPCTEASPFY